MGIGSIIWLAFFAFVKCCFDLFRFRYGEVSGNLKGTARDLLHHHGSGNQNAANDNRDPSACLILGKITKTSGALFDQMNSEDNPISLDYLCGESEAKTSRRVYGGGVSWHFGVLRLVTGLRHPVEWLPYQIIRGDS